MCCRIRKLGVAPKDASLHMCVSEKPSRSRLHPRIKGYTGLADQLLLRAYTCVRGRIVSIPGLHPKAKGYKCLADNVL